VDWEEEMKRLLMVLVAGLLIAALTAPALAWEFAMTGEFEWRYRYFARQGNADLFGEAGVVLPLSTTGVIGLAGPVSPGATGGGVFVQGFSAKGADANDANVRAWFYPEIRINPAVRLRGEYWLTGTNLRGLYDGPGTAGTFIQNNWVTNLGYTGWYTQSQGTPGNRTTPVGMSIGVWEKFWATAQTPWGILAFGRRPFAFGLGWSALHEKDADTESLLLVVPYGPLTFLAGHNLLNVGDNFGINTYATLGPAGLPTGVGPALPALAAAAGTDKQRMPPWDTAFAFTYRNGPVDLGTFWYPVIRRDDHTSLAVNVPAGPANRDDFDNGALPSTFLLAATHINSATTPVYGDIGFLLSVNYLKYNNGRFFFNAEYDFEYADVTRKGGRPVSMWASAWELEFGALCGPAKVTLAAFYKSGPDRRGGWLAPSNNGGTVIAGVFVYDRVANFLTFGGAQEAIKPYEFLLGIYGGGNNAYDNRGFWQGTDLLAYAARLDYAVAANLNVWGSYIYANRASNTATPIGSFRGGIPNTGANFPARINPGFTAAGAQAAAVPNVPDDYLGWEANVGVDWKLLEGLTFKTQFAYWQPGDWFKWAYVDFGTIATTNIGGTAYPINPGRGIDPLIGWQGSLLVEF